MGGVVPPICTPLTASGEVDLASLGQLRSYLVGAGVAGLFALGSTGEAAYLTDEARRQVVRALQAGLLSVDLPPGIKKGDSYSISVRQLSTSSAVIPAPQPPPQTQIATAAAVSAPAEAIWQRVVGAFTFALNISTKEALLLPEERLLAVLRWMLEVTPTQKRWYPVLERYISDVVGRVALATPTSVGPRPTLPLGELGIGNDNAA